MMRAQKFILIPAVLVFAQCLLAGCVAMTGETAGENIDDTVITTEVKSKLAGEKFSTTTRVSVKTERGVVYLTGAVDTADERSKVVQIAKSVRGVRDVVDHLAVRP